MKTKLSVMKALLVMLFIIGFASCKNSEPTNAEIDPFSNGGNERNMIVVISDMHLGADLAYAECKKNVPSLEKLLKRIQASPNVKELVIAGDLLDEWFVPAPINTYHGKDQADFVQCIAETNKVVFDVLNNMIQEKKILVTYVPGNHDLTITESSVELILPGINQKRDPELGLGTYSPIGYPQIAIEHGHRYNFFCAPDPISNQDIAPGTILPPGYFFTRIAALYVSQGLPPAGDTVPVVTQNTSGDESQNLLFAYWKMWDWTLNTFTIENKFDEKIIVTNVDGFTENFSVNDVLPYQTSPGGLIEVDLYNGIQDSWLQRQARNHVPVNIPTQQAIAGSAIASEMDGQAKTQYFLNPDSDVRIVVFGHTHVPTMEASNNHLGQKSIYANSGTWIDHNTLDSTAMNFVVITPQSKEASAQTHVKLYHFKNEIVTEMATDSLRL
ncbi:MAG: metallophosphoesterase [Bacteroidetes bacterium]|jgi:UDP-2,3-diacylglucosamine pyrophosphatase LpxH|nr:metallophosphoesterase [Bacteroidota bacterium]